MTAIGKTLRDARVRRGEGLISCSRATGIGPKYLEALEDDRFDDLPPTAHGDDLVARYAGYLGLDAAQLSGETRAEVSLDPEADTQEIPIVRPRERRDSTFAWVGAGALIGVGGLIVLGGGLGSDSTTKQASDPQPTATRTTSTTSSTIRSTSTAAPSTTQAPPTLRPTPPTTSAIALRLDAKPGKTVWVEVRRGGVSGEQVFAGIVGGGTTKEIRSARPLWLGVAWAPNIAVTLNGEVIDTDGGTESYRVTPRGLTKLGGGNAASP